MNGRQSLLLLGLAGAIAAYLAWSRSRESGASGDLLDEIIVSAQRIGESVANVFVPRGIRNNNPGNIDWIADPAKRWRGMMSSDGRFGIFDTAANGVRAIGGELKASIKRNQTIEQAIHEWAPPIENDTGRYVDLVAKAAGAAKTARLTSAMIPSVALAIIKHENGQQPYDPALVHQWVYS